AEKKIVQIHEAIHNSVPWDVTCVRKKHTVSIHLPLTTGLAQYPYRPVQIILRLYSSPAEILADFDIDAPCCLYSGSRILANPRAIVAMMRQANTVDMTRRSPSYEVRLTKYSGRAFEVLVPTLERDKVDLTIYERAIARMEGLARLLVLEKLASTSVRYDFLESRRTLRGRPNPLHQYARRKNKYKGDLKADTSICGLEMNDYDVATLHIPYGPGWTARRIDKFIEEDPGRQIMSGSFNPIDDGEWSVQVYVGETEQFFAAIAAQDRQVIVDMIKDDFDVNRRDHVGRTALHLAIITRSTEIACDLIQAGTRIMARLVDGRSALHLAAQYDQPVIIRKLFEKSASNKFAAEGVREVRVTWTSTSLLSAPLQTMIGPLRMMLDGEGEYGGEGDEKNVNDEDGQDLEEDEDDKDGDEDDEDETEGSCSKDAKKPDAGQAQEFPEDALDQPDILEVNLPDWDLGFTPLAHAVLTGSLYSIEELLNHGTDATLVDVSHDNAIHPLSLVILRENEDDSCDVLEKLIFADLWPTKTFELFSICDLNADTLLNFPSVEWNKVIYPIVSAINMRHYSMLTTLLVHGVKLFFTEDDVNIIMQLMRVIVDSFQLHSSESFSALKKQLQYLTRYSGKVFDGVFFPLKTAISKYDDVAQLLLSLDVEFNTKIVNSRGDNIDATKPKTLLDWVHYGINFLLKRMESSGDS
ncbi:hypothetical protein H0H87_002590, partial [Tephrocybe sp. NHM501043]